MPWYYAPCRGTRSDAVDPVIWLPEVAQEGSLRMETRMTEKFLTYRGTVYPRHCDHMGHMNVMSYIGKFDEASWQLLSAIGLTGSRFRKEGIGMAAVEQRIQYARGARAGAYCRFSLFSAGGQREVNPHLP